MLRPLSDENFRVDILLGLKRRLPDLDILRVQDAGLAGLDNPTILARAATSGRILLTHDRNTIPECVYDSGSEQLRMPWGVLVDDEQSAGRMIAEIGLTLECSGPIDWQDFVTFIPLEPSVPNAGEAARWVTWTFPIAEETYSNSLLLGQL